MWLVTGTLIVVGLLGSLADRALVATPAWNDIGVSGWATYSLHADHGNGLILYPIQGILPTLLAISAAISQRLHRRGRHPASTPINLTALSMIGVIVTTLIAAPTMLGVDDLDDNLPDLQRAYDSFTLWGVYVRGAFFAIAFLTALWALIALLRAAGGPDADT
jgi:hypothetical protein